MIGKILFASLLLLACQFSNAGIIYLDADTPATGSDLFHTPLVTTYGTITFGGERNYNTYDEEFLAAGSSGANFDIDLHYYAYNPKYDDYYEYTYATLDFDFDVSSFTFIFGGNKGAFRIYARDEDGNTLDSYSQRSTYVGEFAGPWTLTGEGIRQIEWRDYRTWSYAPIDNITIVASTHIPEPSSLAFFLLGVGYLGIRRLRK